MTRSSASRTPLVPLARLLWCNFPQRGLNSKHQRRVFLGPLGNSRSSTINRPLRQVLDCPPGLGPTPLVIVPNITRGGSRPSFCRVMAPAKKSRRLRMVVSMLSHRVLLRTFAYERVVWSVRCRRCKLVTRRRTWCTVWSFAMCFALRVHVTHPYHSSVSITSAFIQHSDFQTNRGGRHMIQLRAEPFEACPHETIAPPRYKNWVVCLYF